MYVDLFGRLAEEARLHSKHTAMELMYFVMARLLRRS